MKRFIYTLLFVLVACTIGFSQAPSKFNYQAVARNADGTFVDTKPIGVRISILESGVSVYTETQTTSTNRYGLFNLQIGGGAGFSTINWAGAAKQIRIDIDPNGGTNFTTIGTAELLSVPYALYANSSPATSSNTITGSGIPSTQGNIGDYYIDNINSTIYGPKLATGWPTTGTKLGGNTFNIGKKYVAGSGIDIDTTSFPRIVKITNTGLKDSTKYIRFDTTFTSNTISGSILNPEVKDGAIGFSKLQLVNNSIPNQIIIWDGAKWTLQTINPYTGKGGVNVSSSNVITVNPDTSSIDTVGGKLKVRKVSGTIISDSLALNKLEKDGATNGQVLKLVNGVWTPSEDQTATSGSGIRKINGDSTSVQTFAIDTTVSIIGITHDLAGNHTIGIPVVSNSKKQAGLLSRADYDKFSNISSDTSKWNLNANGIDYTTGNVGIGTTFPTQLLDIAKTDADNYVRIQAGGNGFDPLKIHYSGILLHEIAANFGWAMRMNANTDHLYFSQQNGTNFSNSLTLKNTGEVIIDSLFKAPSPAGRKMVTVGSDGLLGSEPMPTGTGSNQWTDVANGINYTKTIGASTVSIGGTSSTGILISDSANVKNLESNKFKSSFGEIGGINTQDIKITSATGAFFFANGAGEGRVLTSDATGNATWRTFTPNGALPDSNKAIWNANKILGLEIDTTQVPSTNRSAITFLKYDRVLKKIVLDTLKATSLGNAWNLTGNIGTNTATNFIGTTDDQPLIFKTDGKERLKLGGSTSPNYTVEITSRDEFTEALIGVTNYGSVGAGIDLIRKNGTVLTPQPVTSGNGLGSIRFIGETGVGISEGAGITAVATEAWGAGKNGTGLLLKVTENADDLARPALTISPTGNVGIGYGFDWNFLPVQALDVNGGIRIGNTLNAQRGSIRFFTDNTFQGYNGTQWVTFGGGTGATYFRGTGVRNLAGNFINVANDSAIWNANKLMGKPVSGKFLNGGYLQLKAIGDSIVFVPAQSGTSQWVDAMGGLTYNSPSSSIKTQVGIGVASPLASLHVNGKVLSDTISTTTFIGNDVQTNLLIVTGGNPANGKFLTSDNVGISSWTALDSLSISNLALNKIGATANAGQVLKFKGGKWVAANDSSIYATGGSMKYKIGTGLLLQPDSTLLVDGAQRIFNASSIVDIPVDNAALANGKVLKYDATDAKFVFADDNTVGGSASAMKIDNITIDTTSTGSLRIKDGGVGLSKIATTGATTGKIIKFKSGAWTLADDSVGTGPDLSGIGGFDVVSKNQTGSAFVPVPGTKTAGNVISINVAGSPVWTPISSLLTAGTGIGITGNTINALNSVATWNANQIYNTKVTSLSPGDKFVMIYDDTNKELTYKFLDFSLISGQLPLNRLETSGGTNGQVLKLVNGVWSPAPDLQGGSGAYIGSTNIEVKPNNQIKLKKDLDSIEFIRAYDQLLITDGVTDRIYISTPSSSYMKLTSKTVDFWGASDLTDVKIGVGTLNGPLSTLHIHKGTIRLDSMAGGTVNKMVIVRPNGVFDTQAIPSGGTGVTYLAGNGLEMTGAASNKIRLKFLATSPFDTTAAAGLRIKAKGIDSTLLAFDVIDSSRVRNGYIGYSDLSNAGAGVGQVLTYTASGWKPRTITAGTGWALTGNTITNSNTNFIGTTNVNDLVLKANGIEGLRIDSLTGGVGIGTKAPVGKLNVLGLTVLGTDVISASNIGKNELYLEGKNAAYTQMEMVNNLGGIMTSVRFNINNNPLFELNNELGVNTPMPQGFSMYTAEARPMRFGTNSNLRLIISENGNVGIAKSTPLSKLHVGGFIRSDSLIGPDSGYVGVAPNGMLVRRKLVSSGTGWALTGNSGTTPATNYIGTNDLAGFNIRTNNTPRIGITETGSIGLGNVTLPAVARAQFEQRGKVGNTAAIFGGEGTGVSIVSSSGSSGIGFNQYSDGVFKAVATGYSGFISLQQLNGNLVFGTASSVTTDLPVVSNTTKMTLSNAGQLGIGVTAPLSKLHVAGGTRIDSLFSTNSIPVTGKRMVTVAPNGVLLSEPIPTVSGGTYNGKSGILVSGTTIVANPGIAADATIDTTGNILQVKSNSLDSSHIATKGIGRTDLNDDIIDSTKIANGRIGYSDLSSAGAGANQVLTYVNSTIGWKPRTMNASGWSLTGNSLTNSNVNFIGTTDDHDFVLKAKGNEGLRIDSLTTNVLVKKDLIVNGFIKSSNITETSDARYKTNIATIGNALATVQMLRGVSYDWKRNEYPDMNFKQGKDLGLIAQEVEKVLPELVNTDTKGFKSVQYSHLVSVLVEAIKEQQKQIEALKLEVSDKDSKVQNSENRIKTLESSVSTLNTQMQLLLELVGKNEGVKASK